MPKVLPGVVVFIYLSKLFIHWNIFVCQRKGRHHLRQVPWKRSRVLAWFGPLTIVFILLYIAAVQRAPMLGLHHCILALMRHLFPNFPSNTIAIHFPSAWTATDCADREWKGTAENVDWLAATCAIDVYICSHEWQIFCFSYLHGPHVMTSTFLSSFGL